MHFGLYITMYTQGNSHPRRFKPPIIDFIGRSPPPYFTLTVPPTATAPQGGAAHDSQTIPPPPREVEMVGEYVSGARLFSSLRKMALPLLPL